MFNPHDFQPELSLTTKQCAEVAGKNRRTIVAWIQGGYLPATRLPGARGHYRIRWEDLHETLKGRPVVPKDQTT